MNEQMIKDGFEDFLQGRFMTEYPELCGNKDQCIENFETWICNLQADDFISYANQWVALINF